MYGQANNEFKYKLEKNVLTAWVPVEEARVLSKWSDETEKLRAYLDSSTGFKLMSAEEKKKDETQKKSQELAEKAQQDKKQKENEKELRKKSVEEKRKAAQEKFALAQQEFQKKNAAVWARPGNSPEEMAQKTKEANELAAQFSKAGEVYKKELEEAK